MPLPCISKEFAESTQNNSWFGSRRLATIARQMLHTELRVGIARPRKLIEDFGVDHRSTRLQAMLAEKLSRVELERTIHIAHPHPKNRPHQHFPAPGIELAHPRVNFSASIA